MKKIVALLLCVAMLASGLSVIGYADENRAEYPIIFVTGIGQSSSYLYASVEDKEADIAENSTDRAIADWNLLCNDFSFAFKEVSTYINILLVLGGLLGTLASGQNIVPSHACDNIVKSLFRYNTVDKNGELPDVMYTPCYQCSVADMTPEQRDTFYRRIPCQDVIGDLSEESLYVFNYSAFSATYNNSENLSKFIDIVLDQYYEEGDENKKVVLVPMSMGASVVEAYLQTHGTEGKVARVVSIVGAWYGSEIIADLVEKKYAADAPNKVYNGIVADLIGEPWGYLVNIVLRIFPKATLRSIIDEVVGSLDENLIYKTPSLMVMIPYTRYDAIRTNILSKNSDLAYVMAQTDKFMESQKNLKTTLTTLNKDYGVEFYYIAGYGMEFGGYSSDYEFFQFMESSTSTNSDEIIQIESTATGATSVTAGTQFTTDYLKKANAKYISPDKSVDISTCFFPNHVWLFQGQKHELENNNTALKIAFGAALGEITDNTQFEDTYPIFNESRDVKKLTRDYIPALEKWLEINTPTADQQQLIDKNTAAVNAMLDSTHNDRDADDAVISSYFDMLVSLGVYEAPAEQSTFDKILNGALKGLNDIVFGIFGAKGFPDFKI